MQRNKLLTIAVICCCLLFMGYSLDLRHLQSRLKQEKNHYATLIQQLHKKRRQINTTTKDQTQLAKLPTAYAIYKNQLSKQIVISLLVSSIANTANKYRVQLTAIHPAAIETETWLLLQPLQITATGNYYQLTGFIKSLSKLPYLIILQDLQLKKLKNTLKLKILAIVYSANLKDKP